MSEKKQCYNCRKREEVKFKEIEYEVDIMTEEDAKTYLKDIRKSLYSGRMRCPNCL
jgi:hypothetical protein